MPDFEYGPLNKTIKTQSLELLAKVALQAPYSCSFKVQHHNVIAKFDGHSVNVSQLLKQSNMQQVQFNASDSTNYMKSPNHYSSYSSDPKYNALSQAEKSAITGYTGSDYIAVNKMLYGNPDSYSNVKDTFLKAMMINSGLNKIDPEKTSPDVYRGESSTSESEIAHRIELTQEQEVSQEHALKSTSTNPFVADGFTWMEDGCLIKFVDSNPKDVSGLSNYPGESELLLSPTKIQWLDYQDNGLDRLFIAKTIDPLDPVRDTVSDADIKLFQQLEAFAKAKGVDTSFITDYNQQYLKPQVDAEPLNFKDMLTNSGDLFDSAPEPIVSSFETQAKSQPDYVSHAGYDVLSGLDSLVQGAEMVLAF